MPGDEIYRADAGQRADLEVHRLDSHRASSLVAKCTAPCRSPHDAVVESALHCAPPGVLIASTCKRDPKAAHQADHAKHDLNHKAVIIMS